MPLRGVRERRQCVAAEIKSDQEHEAADIRRYGVLVERLIWPAAALMITPMSPRRCRPPAAFLRCFLLPSPATSPMLDMILRHKRLPAATPATIFSHAAAAIYFATSRFQPLLLR